MTFLINEEAENALIENIINEVFYPAADSVKVIKSFLDKHFRRSSIDDISEEGYPSKTSVALMVDNERVYKTMLPLELLLVLEDQFPSVLKNKEDRHKFFKQIIKDWFENKITPEGILSVNFIE